MYTPEKPYQVLLEEYIECPEGCVFYEPYCFERGAQKGIQNSTSVNQDDLNLLCDIFNCPSNQSKYSFKTPYILDENNHCILKENFESFVEDILSGKSKDDFDTVSFIKCWPQIWQLESGNYFLQKTNNEAIKKREMYIKFDKELKRAQQTFIDNAIEIKKLQNNLN
jgi:hypothetical protein